VGGLIDRQRGGTLRIMQPIKPLSAVAWLFAAASAAAGVTDPGEEIVVTGTALSRAEARRQATEFVDRVGIVTGQTPAARWIDPVCPRAFGLDAARAAMVEQRLRAHAASVGAKLAKPGCTTNLAVIFTADAGSMVKKIARRSTSTLDEIAPAGRQALLAGAAPIRWWYDTEARGKDGQRNIGMAYAMAGLEEGGALPGGGGTVLQYRSSVVSTLSVRSIRSATIVVDVERAGGVPLAAVGDYAAMVGLAEIRQVDSPPAGSILALFDAAAAPPSLTDRDLALLRGLYAMPLDRLARQHRQMLVGEMLKPAKD